MRVIIQKSKESYVNVDGITVGKINNGLVVLVGFTESDTIKDIEYMVNKIVNMRLFMENPEKSVLEINGEILAISQFTLYGDAKKGRRPSYVMALKSEEAKILYEKFVEKLRETNLKVETGIFGADMEVHIINDGPWTIILDSKE